MHSPQPLAFGCRHAIAPATSPREDASLSTSFRISSSPPAPADVTWLNRAQGRLMDRGGIAHHLAARELRFRTYRLFPGSRLLLREDRPLSIGGRAFDLLYVLLAARGMVVSKDELVRRVWPDIFVEECNLRFQVAALRTVLGADRDLIKTVNGRGYLMADDAGFAASSTLHP